jgi:hypothetical protein
MKMCSKIFLRISLKMCFFQAPVRAIQLQHQHRASVATAGVEQPHNHRLTHPSQQQQQQLTPGPGSVSTGQLSGNEL